MRTARAQVSLMTRLTNLRWVISHMRQWGKILFSCSTFQHFEPMRWMTASEYCAVGACSSLTWHLCNKCKMHHKLHATIIYVMIETFETENISKVKQHPITFQGSECVWFGEGEWCVCNQLVHTMRKWLVSTDYSSCLYSQTLFPSGGNIASIDLDSLTTKHTLSKQEILSSSSKYLRLLIKSFMQLQLWLNNI